MKKLVVATLITLTIFGASAQQKIGFVNYEELITAMPEYKTAMTELQDFQASLEKQGQDLNDETEQKISQFSKDSSTYTPSMKEIKREELMKLIQRAQTYQSEAKAKLETEYQKKISPIEKKAQETIKAYALKYKYNYILQSNSILYGSEEGNLSDELKKELGIKDAPAVAPKRP
jgi:outer membrane protein